MMCGVRTKCRSTAVRLCFSTMLVLLTAGCGGGVNTKTVTLVGPQGPAGPAGPTGATGPAGPADSSGGGSWVYLANQWQYFLWQH